MRFGVLGTGMVGRALAGKLVSLGHEVTMGSRQAGNEGRSSGRLRPAKDRVGELLRSFGWPAEDVMDLGDISAARGTEMYLALCLRLWGATGTGHLNVNVVAG